MISFRCVFVFTLICAITQAAPLTADLGQGLAYHRAHALPAELPTAQTSRGQPCVLDLRFATGDTAAATALSDWLKLNARPRSPVFVLANVETSAALMTVLMRRTANAPSLVVIGPSATGFTPDLSLPIAADKDRTAYDAAEQGTALDKLINEVIDKPRNDEAQIARERLAPLPEPETPRAAPSSPATAPSTPSSPSPVDGVLQRAVHLHRTLLALKKL